MAKNNIVYNKDIYDLIQSEVAELKIMFNDHLVKIENIDRRTSKIENWKDGVGYQLGLVASVFGFATTLAYNWIKDRIKL